jgi:hypothetical protein
MTRSERIRGYRPRPVCLKNNIVADEADFDALGRQSSKRVRVQAVILVVNDADAPVAAAIGSGLQPIEMRDL